MKITVFNGSPRKEKSTTQIMVESFLKGAGEAGGEGETVFLAEKNIKPCQGCMNCWLKTPGQCSIRDDMAELLRKSLDSQLVVFASPVYVGGVTGIMKNFIDRLIPIADPHIGINEEGKAYHPNRWAMPPVVLISNSGFPFRYHFDYFRSSFAYMQECTTDFKIIAEIYRDQGPLLALNDQLLLIPVLSGYRKLLQKAGREIVENQTLSESTKEALAKPLISPQMYVQEANKSMDKALAAIKS